MGTSKSFTTPTGGSWTSVKQDISAAVAGDTTATPQSILSGTVRALGSLSVPAAGRGPGSNHRTRTRSGHRGGSVGGAVAGIGGLGSAIAANGLAPALEALGIEDLEGRSASEVIALIADHLAEGANPMEFELLSDALRAALMEAVALQSGVTFEDLESAIQGFLNEHGIEGLIEGFLTHYVFDRVWMAIENHAELKGKDSRTTEALSIAVHNACRSHVSSLISDAKETDNFAEIDWFGRDGIRLGRDLAEKLESRLRAI